MKLARWLFVVLVFLPTAAMAQNFAATLSGANEVPPADPDGTGSASIEIIGSTINFRITVANITMPPVMQHIHTGIAGVNGPIVVNFPGTWSGGTLSGSTTITPATAAAINANPAGHYVNVHTTDFPGGAVRGQLGQVPSQSVPMLSTRSVGVLALLLALGGTLIFLARARAGA